MLSKHCALVLNTLSNNLLKTKLCLIVQLRGAFNNYVNQILPNFDPLPPSSGQKWSFDVLSTLCHVTPCGLSTDPHPPLLVHIVIECPTYIKKFYKLL